MKIFSLKCQLFDITCQYEKSDMKITNTHLAEIFKMLEVLKNRADLKKLEVRRQGNTEFYTYSFESNGGKKWEQGIQIPSDGSEPLTNFNIPDYWRSSEFGPTITLRPHLQELIVEFDIRLFDCKF